MFLAIHIAVSLLSITSAVISVLRPTKSIIIVSHWLVLMTVLSGVIITLQLSVPAQAVCIRGGAYLLAIAILTAVARKKMRSPLSFQASYSCQK